MALMAATPVCPGDFSRREQDGETRWNKVSQALQRLTIEADKLQAIVNGLHRVLREAKQHGVTSDAESMARFRREVEANEKDLAVYRERISAYREGIESGRIQVGLGDQRYQEDDAARQQFTRALASEVQLLAAGAADRDSQDYARAITPLLNQIADTEAQLFRVRAALDAQVQEEAHGVQQLIAAETANLEQYSERLDALDQHARTLIGEVAMNNFLLVRDRLKGIVLRADVGIVQQAWEIREEQRLRLRELQRARAIEEQTLNDELREVLDDSSEEEGQ
jgi:hypothetical protein